MAAASQVLDRLRACMRDERIVGEVLAAYIIPTDDAHQVTCCARYVECFDRVISHVERVHCGV